MKFSPIKSETQRQEIQWICVARARPQHSAAEKQGAAMANRPTWSAPGARLLFSVDTPLRKMGLQPKGALSYHSRAKCSEMSRCRNDTDQTPPKLVRRRRCKSHMTSMSTQKPISPRVTKDDKRSSISKIYRFVPNEGKKQSTIDELQKFNIAWMLPCSSPVSNVENVLL